MASHPKHYVMVTRPKPQGEELCRFLEKNQINTVYLPTIEFGDPEDLTSLQQGIASVPNQDWLIFTSPQAVFAGLKKIQESLPLLSPHIQIAAIGSGTAKCLQKAGYDKILYPESEWHSEGLLALAPFQSIQNQKIAIIRGGEGRMILEKVLKERGAQVLSIVAYQRLVPKLDMTEYKLLLAQNKISVIICTSFQSVAHLKILFGQKDWVKVKQTPLIVVSQRIKMLAGDLGFQTIWVAQNASCDALLQILRDCCDR